MNHSNLIQKTFCFLLLAPALALSQGLSVPVAPPIPIPIPTHHKKPYNAEITSFIKIGKTHKDEVIAQLGSPTETRRDGDIFLYQTDKTNTTIWIVGSYEEYTIPKRYYLLIEFNDDDTVKAFESLSGRKSESQSGIGIVRGANQGTILYSPVDEDTEAKLFKPPVNKAVIYLYTCDFKSSYSIGIDMKNAFSANQIGYIRLEVDPGKHKIWAIRSDKLADGNSEILCEEGQIYFVRLEFTKSKNNGERIIDVSVVDHEEGSKEISKRKLILL